MADSSGGVWLNRNSRERARARAATSSGSLDRYGLPEIISWNSIPVGRGWRMGQVYQPGRL